MSPPDSSLVALENVDGNETGAGQCVTEAIGPFDCQDAPVEFLEPKIVGGSSLESIQIDVIERETPAPVLMNQREGRAGHIFGIDAESLRQSTHERRLSRAQISRE